MPVWTNIFSEHFTGADGGLIFRPAPGGGAWSGPALAVCNFQGLNNKEHEYGAANVGPHLFTFDAGLNDTVAVQVDLTRVSNFSTARNALVARSDGAGIVGDFLRLLVQNSGGGFDTDHVDFILERWSGNGIAETFTLALGVAWLLGTTHTIRFECSKNVLRGLLDGVQVGADHSFANNLVGGGTHVGFTLSNAQGEEYDNLLIDEEVIFSGALALASSSSIDGDGIALPNFSGALALVASASLLIDGREPPAWQPEAPAGDGPWAPGGAAGGGWQGA